MFYTNHKKLMLFNQAVIALVKNEHGSLVDGHQQGETEVLGEKPIPVPFFAPEILRRLSWNKKRSSTMRSCEYRRSHGRSLLHA